MIGIYKVTHLIPKGRKNALKYFRYDFYHRRLKVIEEIRDTYWTIYTRLTEGFQNAIFDGLRDKWWRKYKEDFERKRSSGFYLNFNDGVKQDTDHIALYWIEAVRDPTGAFHDKINKINNPEA